MKNFIVIITTVTLLLLSFSFANKPFEIKGKSTLTKDSLSIDTSYVLSLLKLNSIDSLSLHLNSTDRNYLIDEIKRINVKDKLGKISPFYIRSILSALFLDSVYSVTGSYLILYVNFKEPSKVERIFEDSIEIYFGGLEGVVPQIIFGDLNFDGYKDFFVSFVENTVGGNSINSFYLFDPDTYKFLEDCTINFSSMSFDEDAKEISTGGRIGAISYWGEDYRWNGSKYELYAKESTDYSEDLRFIISKREELINGVWILVWADTTINK